MAVTRSLFIIIPNIPVVSNIFASLITLLVGFYSITATAQDATLYSKSFGNPKNPAVIFLHGGPGYNAYSFEATTADSLASRGFYVISFDQRGSGRSEKTKGKYTLAEAVEDVRSIYTLYHLKTATLMGHSWGGMLATFFAAKHPELVRSIVLVSAPISMQRTLHTIMRNYAIKFPDTTSMEHTMWEMTNGLDPKGFQYSSGAFQLAMSGGFYRPKVSTALATHFSELIKSDDTAQWSSHMSFAPTLGLFKNENYTQLDVTETLAKLAKKIPVFGIYGDEDGLFDDTERAMIASAIGADHFALIKGASHNVFIDQQPEFLAQFVRDVRKKK